MELIHILPKGNLSSKPAQKYELYLADEILRDPEFYRQYVRGTSGYKILDNSLNELGVSMSLEQLNRAAEIIQPDEVVIPDSIHPLESKRLFYSCREQILKYPFLKDLKKMVVVHADSWSGAIRTSEEFAEAGADVLAYSKVTAEQWGNTTNPGRRYDGRVSVAMVLRDMSGIKIPIHFLGFCGFEEFRSCEHVSEYIRSSDSRFFLETDDLWSHREPILSHVSLGSDRVIPDVESRIAEVRRRYESYGLR